MIISLVSPCATVGAYKLMQGQETFYGTVNLQFPLDRFCVVLCLD